MVDRQPRQIDPATVTTEVARAADDSMIGLQRRKFVITGQVVGVEGKFVMMGQREQLNVFALVAAGLFLGMGSRLKEGRFQGSMSVEDAVRNLQYYKMINDGDETVGMGDLGLDGLRRLFMGGESLAEGPYAEPSRPGKAAIIKGNRALYAPLDLAFKNASWYIEPQQESLEVS